MFDNLFSRSHASQLRTLGAKSKYFLFSACAYACWQKQKHYRANLADESEETFDRVNREAFVVLPDGRMGQVYPVVYTRVNPCSLWNAACETFNPLP